MEENLCPVNIHAGSYHMGSAQKGAISLLQGASITGVLIAIAVVLFILNSPPPTSIDEPPTEANLSEMEMERENIMPASQTPFSSDADSKLPPSIDKKKSDVSRPYEKPDPLPSIQLSDETIRDSLGAIPLGAAGQKFLRSENIVERGTNLIFVISKGDVPYKSLPISRPREKFPIFDDGTQIIADPTGYERYNALTAWIQTLDASMIVAAIKPLLPLFREAWSLYGENDDGFDMAVLVALETVINTPEVTSRRLIRKEAVWLYEDPNLESIPDIQKQLIRMGPRNAALIKQKGMEFRSVWLEIL